MTDNTERIEDDEQIKRKASSYSIAEMCHSNKNGRRSSGNSSDDSKETNNKKSSDKEPSNEYGDGSYVNKTDNSTKSIDKRSSQVQKRISDTNYLTTSQNEENNLKELSLNKIYKMASNGIFKWC